MRNNNTMQTFLPYADFYQTARALDSKRLNKQITEAYQILRAITDPSYGWQNHPAVNQWRTHEFKLYLYIVALHNEWLCRARKVHKSYLNTIDYIGEILAGDYVFNIIDPIWLGDEDYHRSHRSNLLRKDPEHYSQFKGFDIPDDLPYIWPSKELSSRAQ